MIRLEAAAATATGLVRANNEDAFVSLDPVFAVADGMGGHAGGEVASSLAVAAFAPLAGRASLSIGELEEAIGRANEEVRARALAEPALREMGTTLVGLARLDEPGEPLLGFNLGDSRLYRLSGGALELISRDHSEVQELVDEGVLSEEEARRSPRRNIVTRSIGVSRELLVDSWRLAPVAGDRYLLCTDGLTNELTDDEIAPLLGSGTVAEAAEALVDGALRAGGRDNVTVVVVEVGSDRDEPARDEVVDRA